MRIAVLLFFAGLVPHAVHGQVRVGGPTVVRPRTGESVTISTSPSAVSLNLVAKGVSAGVPLTVYLNWSVTQTRSLSVYAYFASSTSALSGGSPTVNIPSSAVGSTTFANPYGYTSFTGANPFSGGNASVLLLSNLSISGTGGGNGTLNLRIDCTSIAQLPAGTYTGVLYLQAQAI